MTVSKLPEVQAWSHCFFKNLRTEFIWHAYNMVSDHCILFCKFSIKYLKVLVFWAKYKVIWFQLWGQSSFPLECLSWCLKIDLAMLPGKTQSTREPFANNVEIYYYMFESSNRKGHGGKEYFFASRLYKQQSCYQGLTEHKLEWG